MAAKSLGIENQELKLRHNIQMVKSRLVLVLSCMLLCFLIVALKAAEATVVNPATKRIKVASKSSDFARADIVDRNGTIVATTLKTASAYAVPKEMINTEEAALKLAGAITGIDAGRLLKDFERGGKFVWVKRNITPREQKIINDLGIPGIYFKKDIARIYPQGNLMAHIVGYVNVDNEGLAGVERSFDQELSTKTETPLKLSIDLKLQNILREELMAKYLEYEAEGAVGLIVDVKTGEVMAMVSLPDFDLNFAGSAKPEQIFNRATLGTYEMGSTMKPFTAAMALEYGTTNLDKSYSAAPLYKDGFTIHDFHQFHRNLSMLEVMMYSSNVGTGRIAMEVGVKKQQEFLEKLDMFKKPEIEIPEKSYAIKPKQWQELNGITIAFGHGMSITPAVLAKTYLPLFNGGYLMPLSIIKHKKDEVKPIRQVLGEKAVDDLRTIFRAIVAAGTGRNADAKGYNVGGKTGTSEKVVDGKYSKTAVMSSFVGAFPIQNPKYLVIAIVDDPKEIVAGARPTGGKVAAPVVHNVVMRTGTILGIKPLKNDVTEISSSKKPTKPSAAESAPASTPEVKTTEIDTETSQPAANLDDNSPLSTPAAVPVLPEIKPPSSTELPNNEASFPNSN